jgi:hypothetical protein
MKTKNYLLVFVPVIWLLLVGCQGNPTIPRPAQDLVPQRQELSTQPHQFLGYFDLVIDKEAQSVELLPARTSDIHLNLTGIFNAFNSVGLVFQPGLSDLPNGLVVVDFVITHPFPNNPELSAFDMKAILYSAGTLVIGAVTLSDVDEPQLLNADGYTQWWNPIEFTNATPFGYIESEIPHSPVGQLTATVNPYKLFADVLGPTDTLGPVANEPMDSDEGRAVLRAGSACTRRMEIDFPMSPAQVVYGIGIDCCWDVPVPNPPSAVPDDFPIQANQPEAYRIHMNPVLNSLYYDTGAAKGGGLLEMEVFAWDWQGQQAGNIHSEIDSIKLYSPGMWTGGIAATYDSDTGVFAKYVVDLTGTAVPTHVGPVKIFARVQSINGSYNQVGQPAPTGPLSSWQALTLDIPEITCDGDINNVWAEAVEIIPGTPIFDQICDVGDDNDYFFFTIPANHEITGNLRMECSAANINLGLYDGTMPTPNLIQEVTVTGGIGTIPVETLGLNPGTYNIWVHNAGTEIAPYKLELTGEIIEIPPVNLVEGEYTPDFLYCNPRYVMDSGDYSIMMSNSGLWIFNLSDVLNPAPVSHVPIIPIMVINGVALDGTKLYFLTQYNLVYSINYVDLSDFSSPTVYYDVVTLGQNSQSIEAEDDILYVGYQDGIDVYTTSPSPESPAFLTSFTVAGFPLNMDMLLPGQASTHLVFLVDDIIYSYNVDDPQNIFADGSYIFPDGLYDFSINYDHIYAAVNGPLDQCHVYSIKQTMGALVEDDNLDLSSYIPGIIFICATEGQYVIAVSWSWTNPDVVFIDRTDPKALTYEGAASIDNLASDVVDISSGDNCVFAQNDCGWSIYDISAPSMDFQYKYNAINSPTESALIPADDLLLVLNMPNNDLQQLYSVDLSVPGNIVIADMLEFDNNWIYSIAHNGSIVATSDDPYKIMLVDFSDPYNLTVVNNFTISGELQSEPMYINNNTLYTIVWDGGYVLKAWDITNPLSPVEGGSLVIGDVIQYYAADGDYLYVYNSSYSELTILDITTPSVPSFIGSIEITADEIYDMCIVNHVLYVAHSTGLLTYSLADHENPSQIDEDIIFPSDYETCLDANSANAFMHCDDVIMPVFLSLSNPSNPENVQTFDYQYDYSLDISASDDWLCFMSGYYGPRIYQLY